MLQLKNKKKIYFYLFSLIILSTIFNKNFFKEINKIFSIKKIEIKTNKEYLNKKILSKIDYIKNENIFLFNDEDVIKKLIELKLFDSFSIKKKLPSTIIIDGKQTDIIAITFINQKKYFVGANGNFVKVKEIQNNKKLPTIFGDFKIKNFISLKRELLENNVDLIFKSSEQEKVGLLEQSDIFVMPSVVYKKSVEGFGIAFIEAACYGKPSIGGIYGGEADAIKSGETGYLCNGNDLNALYETLLKILSNDQYKKLGENAFEFSKNFNWDKIIKNYINLI